VSLERGLLSLVSTVGELLGWNSSGSGLEIREYGRGDPIRWRSDNLYPQKLVLTSPTIGGRSVGMIRSQTKATEFVCFFKHNWMKFEVLQLFSYNRSFSSDRHVSSAFQRRCSVELSQWYLLFMWSWNLKLKVKLSL
jgi:hypothetical protein